ncbi:hypothetical protein RAC69_07700 [Microbacterium sp. LS_15]|uniref:hypothetical protein n=1 Tax=Microbacterium sp. LS_15 TaxID=3055790 RepID=UPI0035C20A79
MKIRTTGRIGAALLLAAGITVASVAPAAAAVYSGYPSAAACNADRTEHVRNGGKASPCIHGTWGWQFQTYS